MARGLCWAAVASVLVGLVMVSRAGVDLSNRPAGPRAAPPAATRPGLSGAVGPVGASCRGVVLDTTSDIQAALDAHPPRTTFCLSRGTHRIATPLVPKPGDALVGRRGAVLSGAKVVTGWRREGSTWKARGFLPASPGDHGECLESVPTCPHTEDVFLDKRRLAPVSDASAVVPGTVYADYATNTITIGDDPRSHLLEQAVAPSLVRAIVDDVVVAQLVLEGAANEAQVGAVENRRAVPHPKSGSGWKILHNEVRLNHGAGLGFGGGSVVEGNYIHHQGQLGFGAWGTGSLVTDNEISFNGGAGYSPEWETGGSKIWMTERVTLTHNFVHHNMGPGLWADGGNMDTTYAYNVIADNWGAGIQHEISYDAIIERNEITGNGRRHKGWAWEAGIQIQSSGGTELIEIADNVVRGNANGIALLDSGRRTRDEPTPHGPHVVQNVWVHDNTITLRAGETTGAVQDAGDPGIFVTNNNRFESNTYVLDSLTEPHFSWNDEDLTWTRWRALGNGNDLNGRALLRGAVTRAP